MTTDNLAQTAFEELAQAYGKHVRTGRMSVATATRLIRQDAAVNGIGPEEVADALAAVEDAGPLAPNGSNGHDADHDRHDAGDAYTEQTSPLPLPVIQIKSGELSSLATMAEDLLIAAGVPIYQRGGKLVRPIIETVDATRGRKTKVAQLKALDAIYMRDLLCRHARWQKWDVRGKQMMPINPPAEIPATMLARAGEWMFPVIAGVISAPTMRPNGSLLLDAGYDEGTRLLLVEPPPMPAIPDRPTKVDAQRALKLIEDLLTGFPFVDDVARAVALSALITPVVRGAFPVTPMHASRAPTAGTGKSFLCDIVAAIAIGQPRRGYGRDGKATCCGDDERSTTDLHR
jgi:hypothetical protein